MSAYQPPHELDPPWALGSGEVRGRYDPPPPLPWYLRNQAAVTFCFYAVLVALLLLGACVV
jgi:hypothetical protein